MMLDRLEELLTLWREVRAPEVADLIDEVSRVVHPYLPPPDPSGRASHQEAWLMALEKARGSEMGPLYATLADTRPTLATERLEALVGAAADPRLAHVLYSQLWTRPFKGRASRRYYLLALEVIAAIDDPRLYPKVLEHTTNSTWRIVSHSAAFNAAFEAYAKKLPGKKTPTLGAGHTPLVDEIQNELAEAPAGTTEAELLATVYAQPSDDSARLVYADWLTERGNPLGEFITLQCARGPGERATSAERKLLKRYGETWAGPLSQFLLKKDRQFRRGFLAVGTYKYKRWTDADTFALEEWATVEELDVTVHIHSATHTRVPELILQRTMRALREVRGLRLRDFEALCMTAGRTLKVESLHVRYGNAADVAQMLVRSRTFPKLRQFDASELAGMNEQIAKQLRERYPGLVILPDFYTL